MSAEQLGFILWFAAGYLVGKIGAVLLVWLLSAS